MPTDRVIRTKSEVKINGVKVAVTSYSVNFGLNSVPSAQLRMALGSPFSPPVTSSQTSVVSTGNLKSGDKVEIYHWQTYPTGTIGGLLFSGIITSISPAQGFTGANTSAALTIQCAHRLGIIAGLPALARACVNPVSCHTMFDTYRSQFNSGRPAVYLDAIAGLTTGENNIRLSPNVGTFVRDALVQMYKSEEKTSSLPNVGVSFNRLLMTDAVNVLQSITVAPHMTIGTDDPQDGRNFVFKARIPAVMAEGWGENNALSLMLSVLRDCFGVLIPTASSGHIAPNFPLSSVATKTIKSGEIFYVSSQSTFPVENIVGIRMVGSDNSSDLGLSQEGGSGQVFIQWPAPSAGIAGVYEYSRTPYWAEVVKNYPMMSCSYSGGVKTRSNPEGSEPYSAPKKGPAISEDDRKAFLESVAKTVYLTKTWARNSLTVVVPFTLNRLPGSVIALDVTDNPVASKTFGGNILYGQIQNLTISNSYNSFECSAQLSYVRNEKDNNTFGFSKHPLYNQYELEELKLY